MLEKPELEDEIIISRIKAEYGLRVEKIDFLPLGADLNTAVYRLVTNEKKVYFLKLRRGEFNEASVMVPKYLSGLGIKQIIPPITTKQGGFGQACRLLMGYCILLLKGRMVLKQI